MLRFWYFPQRPLTISKMSQALAQRAAQAAGSAFTAQRPRAVAPVASSKASAARTVKARSLM